MSLATKEAMLAQFNTLKAKYDEAVEGRKKTETNIDNLRPVRHSGKASDLYIKHTKSPDGVSICPRMSIKQHQLALLWKNNWKTWRQI